jgi:hypothetical protein
MVSSEKRHLQREEEDLGRTTTVEIPEKYILTDQKIDFANLTLDVALLSNPRTREPGEFIQDREARSA